MTCSLQGTRAARAVREPYRPVNPAQRGNPREGEKRTALLFSGSRVSLLACPNTFTPVREGAIINGSQVGWAARPVVLHIVCCELPPHKSVAAPALERLCSMGFTLCFCATKNTHVAVVFVGCFCSVFLFDRGFFSDAFEPISFHGELLVPYGCAGPLACPNTRRSRPSGKGP